MSRLPRARAFTLIEVLVALTILALLVIVLSSLLGAVNRAWVSSEQHVDTFQDGRAIVNLIGRELSQAVISPTLQFVTNPPVTDGGTDLTRANSDSIFWLAPLRYSVAGSPSQTVELCEVGYYLDSNLNLKRFFVPPSDNTNYQIYASTPSDTTATWISPFVSNTGVSTTVASNILAFWIRCFDGNGELIPWLSSPPPSGGSPLHYNSAAHFQPATVGQLGSFKYTATSTARAHALPASVEITLVTMDERARKRDPIIPGMPHDAGDTNSPFVNGPADVPDAVDYFARKLVTNRINSARTFSARVVLTNASR